MERLSTLDSSFLRVETPNAHMHVGWLSGLTLPEGESALDANELLRRVEGRLHLVPRFRQRIVAAPVGEPYWADDPTFSAASHLEVRGGDERVTRAGATELVDEFLSRPLARSRPLWEILVIPRVGRGRAVVAGKVHHAMVDGIAAVELGMLLFDPAPGAAHGEAVPWDPRPAGGGARVALDSIADAALDQFRAARRITALGLAPRRTMRVAETMRRAALSLAEDAVRPAPGSFLNRPIGPTRTLVTQRMAFARLERVKRAEEVKLNDVMLALVAAALRRLACSREEEPAPVRAMVPVNVRRDGEDGASGNRITFAFVELPLAEPDARERLRAIIAQTAALRDSRRIAGSDLLLRSAGGLPGPLKTVVARFAASPRMYNLVISNVPGPREPLYAAGARVDTIYPVIPVSEGHAISIGLLSYVDHVHCAVYADPEALPEARDLGFLLQAALHEQEAALRRRRGGGQPDGPDVHARVRGISTAGTRASTEVSTAG